MSKHGWGQEAAIRPFTGGENKLAFCRAGQLLRFFANGKLLFEDEHHQRGLDALTDLKTLLGTTDLAIAATDPLEIRRTRTSGFTAVSAPPTRGYSPPSNPL